MGAWGAWWLVSPHEPACCRYALCLQLLPHHPGVLQYWDQRTVYSHATLMYSGQDVYLAMVDSDEYIVSPHLSSTTVQDAVRKCIREPDAVNMRVSSRLIAAVLALQSSSECW